MTSKPTDLKVKMGTPEEVMWQNIKDGILKDLRESKAGIAMNEKLLPFINEKIAEQQKSLNSKST